MCTVDSGSVKPRQSHKTVCCTCCFFHIAQNCFLITMKHDVAWRGESSKRISDSSCRQTTFISYVRFVDFISMKFLITVFLPFPSIWNSRVCINDLYDVAICNNDICADDTTLYSKCDQASHLWDTLNCGRGNGSFL